MPEINIVEVQESAKVQYAKPRTGESAVGSFKEVYPIPDTNGMAVAVLKHTSEKAIEDLKHENKLLNILKENGYPALQTYGDIFEISNNKYALLMDWVPKSNLIDAKDPSALVIALPAMMLGIPINTGKETWAMNIPKIAAQIEEKAATCDLEKVKEYAKILGDEFKNLKAVIDEKGLLIGDLQILVSSQGKITIIDPLDVLKATPKNPQVPSSGVDFVDVVNPEKTNSFEFVRSLEQSYQMINNIISFCDKTAAVFDNDDLLFNHFDSAIQMKNRGSTFSSDSFDSYSTYKSAPTITNRSTIDRSAATLAAKSEPAIKSSRATNKTIPKHTATRAAPLLKQRNAALQDSTHLRPKESTNPTDSATDSKPRGSKGPG